MVAALSAAVARRRLLRAAQPWRVDRSPSTGDLGIAEDATVKSRVESQIFREDDAPKESVDVSVAYCVVSLKGSTTSEWRSTLEAHARAVEGVNDVENLISVRGDDTLSLLNN
jgi:osmotically-inducible protein OsmY